MGDVDKVASLFPDLNFIVEHCGLPRLNDFTFIAAQEPNVYAGLAVAIALIHTRPRYFSEIMSELLFWLGPDRILLERLRLVATEMDNREIYGSGVARRPGC